MISVSVISSQPSSSSPLSKFLSNRENFEILVNIAKFTKTRDIFELDRVNKVWHAATRCDAIWEKKLEGYTENEKKECEKNVAYRDGSAREKYHFLVLEHKRQEEERAALLARQLADENRGLVRRRRTTCIHFYNETIVHWMFGWCLLAFLILLSLYLDGLVDSFWAAFPIMLFVACFIPTLISYVYTYWRDEMDRPRFDGGDLTCCNRDFFRDDDGLPRVFFREVFGQQDNMPGLLMSIFGLLSMFAFVLCILLRSSEICGGPNLFPYWAAYIPAFICFDGDSDRWIPYAMSTFGFSLILTVLILSLVNLEGSWIETHLIMIPFWVADGAWLVFMTGSVVYYFGKKFCCDDYVSTDDMMIPLMLCCGSLPILLWEIFMALQLDSVVSWGFALVFIPIEVMALCLCCALCYFGADQASGNQRWPCHNGCEILCCGRRPFEGCCDCDCDCDCFNC